MIFECLEHPGPNTIVGERNDRESGVRHISFGCGCTLEVPHEDEGTSLDTPHDFAVSVGDVVRWNGELFRLDEIKTDDEGVWAVILNSNGEEEVLIAGLEYVGEDTLTGLGAGKWLKNDFAHPQTSWSRPPKTTSKTSYKPKPSYKSSKGYKPGKTKKPVKRDSLSTGAFIEDEVKQLQGESKGAVNNVRPLRPGKLNRVSEPNSRTDSTPVGPLPKRKGDW